MGLNRPGSNSPEMNHLGKGLVLWTPKGKYDFLRLTRLKLKIFFLPSYIESV